MSWGGEGGGVGGGAGGGAGGIQINQMKMKEREVGLPSCDRCRFNGLCKCWYAERLKLQLDNKINKQKKTRRK